MQRIDQIIGAPQASQTTTQAGQHRSSTEAMATQFVNEVFRQIKVIFPAWSLSIKTEADQAEAKRQWLQGFVESRITSWEQIHAGLAKARKHDSPFLPSIGQFVGWCKSAVQDAAGLPSESEALSALTREIGRSPQVREWGNYHPSVYEAYKRRQSYDWKNYNYRDLREAFSETWAEVKKLALTGFDFYAALPNPDDVKAPVTEKPVDREVAAQMSAAILADLGVDAVKTHADNEHARAQLEKARKIVEQKKC